MCPTSSWRRFAPLATFGRNCLSLALLKVLSPSRCVLESDVAAVRAIIEGGRARSPSGAGYHNYEQLTTFLRETTAAYPTITRYLDEKMQRNFSCF